MSRLIDALHGSIEFVAWGNYTDLRVLALWLGSLALLALVVWVAWSAGSLVMRGWRLESATEEMVLATGSGLALASAALFVLGVTGLYRWPVVAALAAAAVALPAVVARDARASFRPLLRLGAAVREAPLVVGVLVVLGIGALLPPYRWDETGYHLAYADQWVRAGGLTVNPTMRYPLYTFNWQVLQGVGLMMRSEPLVHLLSWLCALLAALAVQRLSLRLGAGRALATVAALAFALTPVVQRYAVLGMADVPLMAFLTIPVLGFLAAREQEGAGAWAAIPAALAAAMFVGMKVTGMLFVPLFLAIGAVRFRGAARIAFAAVFCLVGVLWYARNLVLAGDPAPPLVAQALGRPTPGWSESDLALQAADLARGLERDAVSLAALPIRMLRATPEGPLRDWPALGYVLVFPLSLLLARELHRRRRLEPLVVAWYAVGVWIVTSYLIRYAVFLPLAAVLAAVVIQRAVALLARDSTSRRASLAAAAAGVVLLVGPTPAALRYAKASLSLRVPVTQAEREAFLVAQMPEATAIRAVRATVPSPARLYTTDSQLRYHYQRAGYEVIGDDFHEARFRDFRDAALAGRAERFLRALDVDRLVLSRHNIEQTIGVSLDSMDAALAAAPPLRPLLRDSAVAIWAPLEMTAEASAP